jgi:hypothetical protein
MDQPLFGDQTPQVRLELDAIFISLSISRKQTCPSLEKHLLSPGCAGLIGGRCGFSTVSTNPKKVFLRRSTFSSFPPSVHDKFSLRRTNTISYDNISLFTTVQGGNDRFQRCHGRDSGGTEKNQLFGTFPLGLSFPSDSRPSTSFHSDLGRHKFSNPKFSIPRPKYVISK